MYRHDNQAEGWFGPARILGFEKKVPWCLHSGIPVATSLNRMRPANVSEILACMVLSKGNFPEPDRTRASGEQQGFIDTNISRRRALDEDILEERPSRPSQRRRYETKETTVEPELEQDPVVDYPMVESVPVRITGGTDEPTTRTDGSFNVYHDATQTPLERAWNRTSPNPNRDPGLRLIRELRGTPSTAASSASASASYGITLGLTDLVGMSATEEFRKSNATMKGNQLFSEWLAFFSERVPHNTCKNKRLEKRGKLIRYCNASEEIQRGLDASRAKEWDKWLKYDAAEVISQEQAQELIGEGAEEIGTQWIEIDKNDHLRTPDQIAQIEADLRSRLVAMGN